MRNIWAGAEHQAASSLVSYNDLHVVCRQAWVASKAREHFRSVTVRDVGLLRCVFCLHPLGLLHVVETEMRIVEAERSVLIVKLKTFYASVFWLYSLTSCISCYHVTILKDLVYGCLFWLFFTLAVYCVNNISDERLLSLPGRCRASWHVATQPVDTPNADDTLMASLISRRCVITVVLAQTGDFGVLLALQTLKLKHWRPKNNLGSSWRVTFFCHFHSSWADNEFILGAHQDQCSCFLHPDSVWMQRWNVVVITVAREIVITHRRWDGCRPVPTDWASSWSTWAEPRRGTSKHVASSAQRGN